VSKNLELEVLDKQSLHWEKNFSNRPDMFGTDASVAAVYTLDQFKKNNFKNIVELGSGQGRDSIFFAKNGLNIQSLDYSQSGIKRIQEKSTQLGLGNLLDAKIFDVRERLPFDDNSIDGCYSHMLYCMALSFEEIENLNNEVHRVLKQDGLNVFTVRNIEDGDYQNGIHRGEDLYESNGFIVHFFSKDKIKKLLRGFELLDMSTFEEGSFPRRLYRVTMRKI
jgi:SAM-dependent methyltransferase|tara:strand:- start:468 stop:1133 length:666 start_codon:yes stop_codon:yes gene_type:complete